MKRLSVGGLVGIVGSAFLLTGACGGSSFTSGDASGGLAGSAGAGESGAANSGGSQSSAGESGSSNVSGSGGLMSVAGAGGSHSSAGAGGSVSTAGSGGSMSVAGAGGSHSSAGAGGVVGSAGSSGAAGASGSGGNSCVTGTVTFKMVPAAGSAPSAFCSSGCNAAWLTVTDPNSKTIVLDRGCGSPDCMTCAKSVCPPIACVMQTIPAEGLSRAWDETQWNPSTCGPGATACSIDQCVPAGKYKAKMCAAKNTMPSASFCSPGDAVCTEVDFVLPGATTVQGTIGG